MKHALLALTAALLAATAAAPASAQPYPNKPVRMVIGFPPGGTTDILARDIADALGKALGQSVVADNRPGAGGNLANELVAKSKPDGYTILFTSSSISVAPAVYAKLAYDPLKDLQPINAVASVPNLMAVPVSLPANNVKEYVEMARQKPGTVTYASAGNGSVAHLSGALLASISNVQLQHIPYKGNSEATTDLITGTVQANFNQINFLMPLVKSGKLKALAIVAKERSPLMPDVPTMAEQGFAAFDLVPWFGIFAPAGTPRPIVERLAVEIDRIVKSPETARKWEPQGATGLGGTSEEFTQRLKTDIEKMGKLAREAGAKVD